MVRKSIPRFTKSPSLVLIGLVLTEIQAFKNVKYLQRNVWKTGQIRYALSDHVNQSACCHLSLNIIIHQTHYEKSDWSRAFNQFTIACELDMINAISAADIAFIMSSSMSAWLLSPLECSPQKQNG